MITQDELDAAAKAAIKVFTDAGYGWAIDMDKARALAAPMIKAYRAAHHEKPLPVAISPEAAPVEANHIASFFEGLVAKIKG